MSADGHRLLLAFDSDSEDFTRGFEVGRLWARARAGGPPFTETVHASNVEMLMRVAEASGRSLRTAWEGDDEVWIGVEFGEPGSRAA